MSHWKATIGIKFDELRCFKLNLVIEVEIKLRVASAEVPRKINARDKKVARNAVRNVAQRILFEEAFFVAVTLTKADRKRTALTTAQTESSGMSKLIFVAELHLKSLKLEHPVYTGNNERAILRKPICHYRMQNK